MRRVLRDTRNRMEKQNKLCVPWMGFWRGTTINTSLPWYTDRRRFRKGYLQQKCSWAEDCALNYPVLPIALKPRGSHGESLERKEGLRHSDQQQNFNLRHKACDLPKLQPGDPVWIRDQNRQGQVVSRTPEPRSYLVRTDLRTVRRNCRALVPTSHDSDESNRRWTPPARVSTTSDIATPTVTVETQAPWQPLQRGVFHVLQERYLHSQSHLHRTEWLGREELWNHRPKRLDL